MSIHDTYKNHWKKNFYHCHVDPTCYSHEFCVDEEHYAKVRLFADNGCGYHISIEEGISDCMCGPRKQWFNYKTVACDFKNSTTGEVQCANRPWVLTTNHCDEYIELPPGVYRFCVLDCNYLPVTPGESDILLRVTHCIDNRLHVANY